MKMIKKTKKNKKVQKSVRYRPPTPVICNNGEKKGRGSGRKKSEN